MKRVERLGVVSRADSDDSIEMAHELAQWLERRGRSVALDEVTARAVGFAGPIYGDQREDPPVQNPVPSPHEAAVDRGGPLASQCTLYDMVIVLGGDGTLLATARNLAGQVPILGVNLGRMGFLTELRRGELYRVLGKILNGEYGIEERSLLSVELVRAGGGGERFRALNDAVVAKTAVAKIIQLAVKIDDQPAASFRGDGLILSTPTGSTAYSLSAGGPIVDPSLPVVVLTPICPHSLSLRPLVVPDTRRLDVELASRRDEEVYLAIDGQEKTTLRFGDLVRVTHCPDKVRLVKASGRNFHHNLREKLRWGGLDDVV